VENDREREYDAELRELLRSISRIAVVGIKGGDADDAFRVPRYLQEHGYRIVPVSPKLERVLGECAYASLAEIPHPVDLVNLFRAPRHIARHADEILAMTPTPRAVWMQLGIAQAEVAARLRGAGLAVIEDRCLMVEHRRLLGGT
jgi:predicted CoA-binding protein